MILGLIVLVLVGCSSNHPEYGQLTDERDGKTYKTVKIGAKEWMAENLHDFQFY